MTRWGITNGNIQDMDKLLAEVIITNIFQHMIASRFLSTLEQLDLPENFHFLIKEAENLSKATDDFRDYVNKRLHFYKKMIDMDISW